MNSEISMINNLCTVSVVIRKIVGGFKQEQMIAVGVAMALALLLGFFIGAVSLYSVGVKKGKRTGERLGYRLAQKQMKEKGLEVAKKESAKPRAAESVKEEGQKPTENA